MIFVVAKDFDENDGCLEKVGASFGQGGFATYLSLSTSTSALIFA